MDMDEQIGRNLARLRGDMTQQELANRMKELGWKWSQSTVWSIERGDRPLRLAEAAALQSILDPLATSMLLWGDGQSTVQSQMHDVSRAWVDLLASLTKFYDAQIQLAIAADDERTALSGAQQTGVRDWLAHNLDTLKAEFAQQLAVEEAGTAVGLEMTVEELRRRAADGSRGFYSDIWHQAWEDLRGGERSETT